ncbi:MAG: RluA family pseudouridine synthase [Candidatus Aenigmatarchaeota archaeon]
MEKYFLRVPEDESGKRIDSFIAGQLKGFSRTFIKKLIEEGKILLDGKICKPSSRIQAGQGIEINIPAPNKTNIEAQPLPLKIIYEDEFIIVINKDPGVVVHPGAGNTDRTLVNAIVYHCKDLSGIGGSLRPGIVHRLDKDTSGLLVVAKRDDIHQDLSNQFREHRIYKRYLALVFGQMEEAQQRVENYMGRDPRNRKKMAVIRDISNYKGLARLAILSYRVIEDYKFASLLEVFPETGRTHQIRVQFSYMRHPLIGDSLYGGGIVKNIKDEKVRELLFSAKRHMLHAINLGFIHPVTKKYMEFEAPIPDDFTSLIKVLEMIKHDI